MLTRSWLIGLALLLVSCATTSPPDQTVTVEKAEKIEQTSEVVHNELPPLHWIIGYTLVVGILIPNPFSINSIKSFISIFR